MQQRSLYWKDNDDNNHFVYIRMSILPRETIEVIAQTIGINKLSSDVADALAPDVEYRLREIMQEAIKCMRHSKRTVLTTEDVNSALSLRNIEPLYGFASGDPLRFKKAIGHKDLYYIDDKEMECKDIIETPIASAPVDTAVLVHWLAIEGVQPAISENPTVEALALPVDNKNVEQGKDDGQPVEVKLPVKHVLSKEFQRYFEKITELVVTKSDTILFKDALLSLSRDTGLHPLLPYFTFFISDEVTRSLDDLPLLFSLMRVTNSLLQNPYIQIEPYLHQLMPSIMTCLISKRLGLRVLDNHWELRNYTADLVASICMRFGHVYYNLQPRVTKTLLNAFLDPKKSLTQHYGAVRGLSALGPSVVRLLILPKMETYLQLLEPEMLMETQKNEVKRYEAWRVHSALVNAVGVFMYESVKLFPEIYPLFTQTALRPTAKLALPLNLARGSPDVDSVGDSTLEKSTKQTIEKTKPDCPRRRGSTIAEVWKDDANTRKLLSTSVGLFSEAMIPFIPTNELALHL